MLIFLDFQNCLIHLLLSMADISFIQFPLFHEILEWSIHRSYLVGREISTLSLALHIGHAVTAGINLFLIVLSRGSSK